MMLKKPSLIAILGLLLIIGSCAPSSFQQYYYSQLGNVDITSLPTVILTNNPKLYSGNDPLNDDLYMSENGYLLIGYSSFNSGYASNQEALEQAKQAHAEVVIVYSQFTNTVSGVVPITTPITQTSTTTIQSGTYGSGFGGITATTNTYGTRTTNVPYSFDRYDYYATYWVKLKEPMFGTFVRDLTTSERQQIGSNKGIIVTAVIKNSVAFKADVFRGDIIKRINGNQYCHKFLNSMPK
jgi:hypothetical protein